MAAMKAEAGGSGAIEEAKAANATAADAAPEVTGSVNTQPTPEPVAVDTQPTPEPKPEPDLNMPCGCCCCAST